MGKKNKNSKKDPKEYLLLGIKKDEEEIRKYEKLLKIKKRKNKSKLEELFCDLDPVSDDETVNEEAMNIDEEEGGESCDEKEDDELCEEEGNGELCEEGEDGESCEEEVMDISEEEISEPKAKPSKKETVVDEEYSKIKRSILAHLNRLCESQMMKCLDGIENIWNEYPRGDVRDVFIKESINYMKLSGIELAVFVACLHFRLIKQTNLIAFYMEHLIEKLDKMKSSDWSNESTFTTVTTIYKFIAYITRLEVIDTNLIIDLMANISNDSKLPQLKVLSEISSIIGFFSRKNNAKRCDELIAIFKEKNKANMIGVGDLNEMKSFCDAFIDKLTTSKAKNDVVFDNIVKYRKLMRTWCKKLISNENLALRLNDFRGENRVRWWLVGSAINPNIIHNKNAAALESASSSALLDNSKLTQEELEWNKLANELGFITEGKQRLFRLLMRGKSCGDNNSDGSAETLEQIYKLSSANNKTVIVPESEIIGVIIRCLALERQFCQFYVDLLVGLMEVNRRFRQLTKCAIWDLLAQPNLVESARINIGRCLGQLISAAGFPVNSLRKFNFLDTTPANVSFLKAVFTEIVEESLEDTCELLQEMSSSISEKFVNNLRIFLKKNFKGEQEVNKTVLIKVNKCIEFLTDMRRKTL